MKLSVGNNWKNIYLQYMYSTVIPRIIKDAILKSYEKRRAILNSFIKLIIFYFKTQTYLNFSIKMRTIQSSKKENKLNYWLTDCLRLDGALRVYVVDSSKGDRVVVLLMTSPPSSNGVMIVPLVRGRLRLT